MSGRLDPRPLANALIEGLRQRAHIGEEREDRFTKLFLFGVPIAVFIVATVAGLQLKQVADVVAGATLLVGALLAGFSQLASWRERLTERSAKIDGVKMRMLDEAVAHVLASTLAAVLLTGALVVLANATWGPLVVGLSSLAAALMAYLAVSLYIVVNLLWDSYRAANPRSEPVARPDADRNTKAS